MFELHSDLVRDTVEICRWPLCRVQLMDDATYPWIILVPARAGIREIHELTQPDRAILVEEIARAAEAMQRDFKADKMNVAALGNQTPQLHIHAIARFHGDPAWAGPIWSKVPVRRYPAAERMAMVERMRNLLAG